MEKDEDMKPLKMNGYTIRRRMVHWRNSKINRGEARGEWQYQVAVGMTIKHRAKNLAAAKRFVVKNPLHDQ